MEVSTYVYSAISIWLVVGIHSLSSVKLKPFYKFMLVAAMVITVVTVICWIVLTVYITSNGEFI